MKCYSSTLILKCAQIVFKIYVSQTSFDILFKLFNTDKLNWEYASF